MPGVRRGCHEVLSVDDLMAPSVRGKEEVVVMGPPGFKAGGHQGPPANSSQVYREPPRGATAWPRGSFAPGHLPGSIYIIVGHKTIVISIHQGGGDHEIGGGAVAGNRNVPNNCHAQERLDIWIVGHRFKRIPEKDEKR